MSSEVTQEQDPWVKVPRWLLSTVSPTAVVVYAALANYAGLPDGARPALKRVATDLGISVSTVQRAVHDLSEVGAVSVEARWGDEEKRVRLPSRYHLNLCKPAAPLVTGDQTPLFTDDQTPRSQVTYELEEVSKTEVVSSGPPPVTGAEVQQRGADSTPTKRRGTRVSRDWLPDAHVRQQMHQLRPDVDLALEHDKFIDYWTAKPGKEGTKLDWNATWRNWIRNAKASPSSTVGRKQQVLNTTMTAAMRRAIERDEANEQRAITA